MKKLFYFSKHRLQFVEIKNHKLKHAVFLTVVLIFSSLLTIGGGYLYTTFLNPDTELPFLKNENQLLKGKLNEIILKYESLDKELDSLIKINADLRIAANLQPISSEERQLGIGGGSFDNILDFLKLKNRDDAQKAFNFVESVERKLEFEKSNYIEIENALARNAELYKSIPAIRPCTGSLSANSFGMRKHPVLGIYRMHNGIDIMTDPGTSVYVTGDGRVDYVGRKGGFGLCVEIDHGFGYRTIYAHLSSVIVKEGQKIKRGSLIAKTGNSGLSSGPHLHYEVIHNGINHDPEDYFFDNLGIFKAENK